MRAFIPKPLFTPQARGIRRAIVNLTAYYIPELLRQADVPYIPCSFKHRSNLLDGEACISASYLCDEEYFVRVRLGIGDEVIHLSFDSLQRGSVSCYCVAASLRTHSLTLDCTEVAGGNAGGASVVLSVNVASEHEYLVGFQIGDGVRGDSASLGLHVEEVVIPIEHAYHSEAAALRAWNERKQRINWDNVFVICCDEGLTFEDMQEYDNLPYVDKILFTHIYQPEIKSAVYAKKFKDKTDARLLNIENLLGKRYYQNYIDYVNFLNRKN